MGCGIGRHILLGHCGVDTHISTIVLLHGFLVVDTREIFYDNVIAFSAVYGEVSSCVNGVVGSNVGCDIQLGQSGVSADIGSSVNGVVGSCVDSGICCDILLGVILIRSVVVNVMSAGLPWLLSLRVNWLVILGGVSTGIGRYISGGVSTDISSSVGSCIGSSVNGSILLSVVLIGSVVVDIVSTGFPWLLSFGVDWLVELGGVGACVSSRVDCGVSSSVGTDIGSSVSSSVGSCIDGGVARGVSLN